MRLQGAIFDMDGTLTDSMPMWNALGETLMHKLGLEPDPQAQHLLDNGGLRPMAEYISSRYRPDLTPQQIVDTAYEHLRNFYANEVTLKPDVEKFLAILKMEGVWMYLATATDRPLVELALRRTGLERYFRGVITTQEAGRDKNDPLIYEKALTRLRCLKRDCVVFEDAPYAIRTALKAGFRVAMVREPCYPQAEVEADVTYRIDSYTDWLSMEE